MKNNLKTKIIAFLALFGILISVIGTGALILFETYFSSNNNQVEVSSEWEEFINSMSEEELEKFMEDLDDKDSSIPDLENSDTSTGVTIKQDNIEIENTDNL